MILVALVSSAVVNVLLIAMHVYMTRLGDETAAAERSALLDRIQAPESATYRAIDAVGQDALVPAPVDDVPAEYDKSFSDLDEDLLVAGIAGAQDTTIE